MRGNVFLRRGMVGERRVVVCFLFSFVPANSPLYTPSLKLFGVRLNWVWISVLGNSCIYLPVHSLKCY